MSDSRVRIFDGEGREYIAFVKSYSRLLADGSLFTIHFHPHRDAASPRGHK